MAGVYFSSGTNSTLFTTCCNCAITDDQNCCPSCGEEVPFTPKSRWDMAMIGLYGYERVAEIRKKAREKY